MAKPKKRTGVLEEGTAKQNKEPFNPGKDWDAGLAGTSRGQAGVSGKDPKLPLPQRPTKRMLTSAVTLQGDRKEDPRPTR